MSDPLSTQAILDALSQGVMIFGADNRLVRSNLQAASLLGTDLLLIRERGWSALRDLFDGDLPDPEQRMDAVRRRALNTDRPVAFHVYRMGEFVPCTASVITAPDGQLFTLISLQPADWTVVSDVLSRFRRELRDAVESTLGHISLINKTMSRPQDDEPTQRLARRIGGFSRLIAVHMDRAQRLMDLLERMEALRVGRVRAVVQSERKKVELSDFVEDFVESLDHTPLLDPESEKQDARARLQVSIPSGLRAYVVRRYLVHALREVVRNAMMYSLRGTPISLRAVARNNAIQIDVMDEGYGIREQDWGGIFRPFERGSQPQIVSEFGYGLALYLCKYELEAMNGRIWFSSQENVGTTFSIMLPMWREADALSEDA